MQIFSISLSKWVLGYGTNDRAHLLRWRETRSLGRFGVLPDGEIFINPAILSPWARLSAVISGVAIVVKEEGVFSILVPLLWAKENYPESAEMLNDIEIFVRATSVEIEKGQSYGA
jgi:hypothetical protein